MERGWGGVTPARALKNEDLVRRVEELLGLARERLAEAMASALTGDAADDYEGDEGGFWVGDALLPPGAYPHSKDLDDKCYALIRALSADAGARRSVASRLAIPKDLEELQPGAGWLRLLLSVLDEEPLLVLHFPSRRGFRTRISGISSNFQLHTLLADALIERSRLRQFFSRAGKELGRPAPHPDVVAVCDGSGPQTIDRPSEGVWNLYQWRAIDATGNLPLKVDPKLWIWGEGIPTDIERFGDSRVLILGPPAYAREWNTAREFAGLHASVRVEAPLTDSESKEWLRRFAGAK